MNRIHDQKDNHAIIHQLILRSGYLMDLSLYSGKMGLVIFFTHYRRVSSNAVYESIANELMEELMREMHKELPVGFATGLSGIGWGIEYLIQHGFVEGDSLDVCEEMDQMLMKADPGRITDYSIETGIGGILLYVLAHIQGVYNQNRIFPFDDKYLHDLYVVSGHLQNIATSSNTKTLIDQYIRFYQTKEINNKPLEIIPFIEGIAIKESQLDNCPLGINKGLAGILLEKYITEDKAV